MNNLFSEKMKAVKPSAIDELLALGADKSIISFGGGYPDASLFPKNKLIKIFSEIINDPIIIDRPIIIKPLVFFIYYSNFC